jgi:hypothetical protein
VWKYDEKPTTAGFGLASITEPEATLKHTDGVTATCYNSQLNIILTGTNNGVVLVWCSRTYRYIANSMMTCIVLVPKAFHGIAKTRIPSRIQI